MNLEALDQVVAWRTKSRDRPVLFEGARERLRIGPVTRFLLPDLHSESAAPGDLVRLYRLPIPGSPIAGFVNFTRQIAAVVPPYRRLVAACAFWAVALVADLRWGLDGAALLAGLIATLPMIFAFRFVAHEAEAMTDDDSAYRARVCWQLARHRLAPKAPPPQAPAQPPDWVARLADSYAGALPSHEWRSIANLPVPDGRLTACDPYDIGEEQKNVIEVPPGTYPVVLAVGLFGPPGSGLFEARVAHAWVQLRDAAVMGWEPICGAGGSRMLVGVDSGLASFSCAGTAPVLRAAYDDGSPDAFTTRLEEVLEEKLYDGEDGGWTSIEAGEARLVVFESGYGDGLYDIYRGVDDDGKAVAIAIDFKVADSIYFAP
jgi:hypothetical protein